MKKQHDEKLIFNGNSFGKTGLKQQIAQWVYGFIEDWLLQYTNYMMKTEKRKAKMVKMYKPIMFPQGVILSTQAVCRYIDFIYSNKSDTSAARMAVTDCVCQTSLKQTREPRKKDIVLLYVAEMYTTWSNTGVKNLYDPIDTAEEAKKMVWEFHKAGLLHNVLYCFGSGKYAFVLCNCDDQICVPYRAYMAGRRNEFGAGPEIIEYDEKKCVGIDACGKCLSRCVLKACGQQNGKSTVNYTDCLGCGLCTSTCVGGARTLVRRNDYKHEDIITTKILLGES